MTENDVKNKVLVVVACFSWNVKLVNKQKTFFPLTTNFSNLLLYLDCCIVICKPHDFTLHQKLMHEKYDTHQRGYVILGNIFVKMDLCKNHEIWPSATKIGENQILPKLQIFSMYYTS